MTTSTLDADVVYTDSYEFDSSSIDLAFYDDVTGSLFVRFHSSETLYQYGSVDHNTWLAFKTANSPGQFYAFSIKGRFPRGVEVESSDAILEKREVPVVPVTVTEAAAAKPSRTLVLRVWLPENLIEAAQTIVEVGELLDDFDYEAEVV